MKNKIMVDGTIADLLFDKVITAASQTTLAEVYERLISEVMPEVVVIDTIESQERPIGIMTLLEIMEHIKNPRNHMKPIADFIHPGIPVVSPNDSILSVYQKFEENHIDSVPLVQGGTVLGIIRYVTALKAFYSRLVSNNKKYNEIINHMHESVAVTGKNGHVLLWNKRAEEYYGIKEEDILYKKIEQFFPTALTLTVLKNRTPIENVYHSPKADYHVIISAVPLFIENEFVGVVSTERDITDFINMSLMLENAKSEIDHLKNEVEKISEDVFSIEHVQGKNPEMQKIIQLGKYVSRTNTSILITGESGTGKEIFSRAIHKHSKRRGHFVPVNCSAIPQSLFESEFFGYVGGAFTGALKGGKVGLYELANDGTLFLDEIGDMPFEVQSKLLRVLQEGVVYRVGGTSPIRADVRVISATHKDLREMVRDGKFREDLYYRLNVIEIKLPPLRERREDIPLLFRHFMEEVCKKNQIQIVSVDKKVFEILLKYPWPGNIRELKNVVEYMVILCTNGEITVNSIPQDVQNGARLVPALLASDILDMGKMTESLERDLIAAALIHSKGNKAEAAKLLNIKRGALYYKLKLYNME